MVQLGLVMKGAWKSAMFLLNVKNVNLLETGVQGFAAIRYQEEVMTTALCYCRESN